MRDLNELNKWRVTNPDDLRYFGGDAGDGTRGAFILFSPIDGKALRVIAANGDGWDHVSVSRVERIPHWIEMQFIHRSFFKPHEIAMELHVPSKDHINCHPRTLHLWRPHVHLIPLPPARMV